MRWAAGGETRRMPAVARSRSTALRCCSAGTIARAKSSKGRMYPSPGPPGVPANVERPGFTYTVRGER